MNVLVPKGLESSMSCESTRLGSSILGQICLEGESLYSNWCKDVNGSAQSHDNTVL
jgi:hypothetical protein